MAPQEAKVIPKVQQRVIAKRNSTKKTPLSTSSSVRKVMTTKTSEKTPRKATTRAPNQQRIDTLATPKRKENKPAACPDTVTKSAKKSWKRRPTPAHSGVPRPEKMQKIVQQLQAFECSF